MAETGAAVSSPAKLALELFSLLARRDAAGALALFDPEGAFEIVPAGIAGVARKEGRAFLEELVAAFPDLLIHVRSVMEFLHVPTELGDLAVVEIKLEGTQARDFLGILNQEKHVDVDQAWMIRTASGRIAGLRAYWCQNQLLRRLAVKRLDRISILGEGS
jgi:ketosteroid isomerase-like protein